MMTILLQFVKDRPTRLDVFALFRFLVLIAGLVGVYSVIFHYVMEYEGRSESWITGVYWTLTVMSTLGFGDITFNSDLGKVFSSIVLLSGLIFFLILLPFTFIEFFYAPWMRAQEAARAPTKLPENTRDHAILTRFDPITKTLIEKLKQYQHPYVILVSDLSEALRLHDLGYKIMLGDLDDPVTYQNARVDQALFVASTASDQVNANVAFTVREISETVRMIAVANDHAAVDILELAGCSHVLQVAEILGQALGRQVVHNATTAHIVGQFDELVVAEAAVRGTSLVNQTLQESQLRNRIGVNVVGIWERGKFQLTTPDIQITDNTTLMLTGSKAAIDQYNVLFGQEISTPSHALIIGGGRVGRAVARALISKGIDYRIVEKSSDRVRTSMADKYVVGDAADIEVLEEAGIHEVSTILITTHDDDMNVYLTIYCRRLRPDTQIISRAGLERNISTLHRAGADFVMSYASTGANSIINLIGRNNILMVAEGLEIFKMPVPASLVGKTIAALDIRKKSGCTVVALQSDGHAELMVDPYEPLPSNTNLILMGTPEAEERFLKTYCRTS
ncbi:MAG: NAD-binding protein [Aggregatilineales bacterium]